MSNENIIKNINLISVFPVPQNQNDDYERAVTIASPGTERTQFIQDYPTEGIFLLERDIEVMPPCDKTITIDGNLLGFKKIMDPSIHEKPCFQCLYSSGKQTSPALADHIYFSDHALERMQEPDRLVTYEEICEAFGTGYFNSYNDARVYSSFNGVVVVVKFIPQRGYFIITVYRRQLEKDLQNLLEEKLCHLDFVNGDQKCINFEGLKNFYEDVYENDPDIYRKAKSAYNLAMLIHLQHGSEHGDLVDDYYYEPYLGYLLFAINKTGHQQAEMAFYALMCNLENNEMYHYKLINNLIKKNSLKITAIIGF